LILNLLFKGRLLVFHKQVNAKYSFGIDENSAIVEKAPGGDIEFIGQKGTVVFTKVYSLSNATMHYLTQGDVLKPSGEIVYPSWKQPCPPSSNKPRPSTSIFSQFLVRSMEVAKYYQNEVYKGYIGRSPVVEVEMQKMGMTKTM
jgi:hypothetical protein